MHPRLFTALILIDPVIMSKSKSRVTAGPDGKNPTLSLVRLSAFRSDQWPSQIEAAQAFKKSRFYQRWDDKVLDLWIQHGLREHSTKIEGGCVTLCTPKDQEVFTFLLPKFDMSPQSTREGTDPNTLLVDHDPEIEDEYPFYRVSIPRERFVLD